ncbi:DUF1176 domain-containing protein [Neptunicoccus cionae]|uniref:DUF1176 domain-containing protein n=1 Tax=Neptunicoccus cionae TaxID=2035344 RepID=UPI000C786761|nr:DUF1176 domain-containing protein [Amylibacter cionae]PLS22675.1 hypothetical protein C0U40_00540 [Amylibacter cionae]
MINILRLMVLLVVLGQMSLAQDMGQSMRQWWVECDRRGYCTADIEGLTGDYETLTLRIERSEAANSPILLELTPETLLGEGAAVRFDIPGAEEGITRKVDTVSDNSFTLSEPYDSPLLQAIMTGETLFVTIDFQSERGAQVFEVPLAGAIDSLTVMDITQRRLGRRDAIVARGAAPADSPSDVFPRQSRETGDEDAGQWTEDSGDAPALEDPDGSYVEVLYTPAELPAAVVDFALNDAACGDLTGPLNEMGAIVNKDASGRTTYLVPCRIGQANVSYYIVVHDPANGIEYAMQRFELPPAHNAPDRATIMNPQWLAGQNQLVSTRYANMNLNCGAYEIHNWIAEQQRFELSVYRAKEDCTGPHVEPQRFPLEWTLAEMGD